jgi:hypothetical protein
MRKHQRKRPLAGKASDLVPVMRPQAQMFIDDS